MYGHDFTIISSDSLNKRMKPNVEQVQVLDEYMLKCVYPTNKITNDIAEETGLPQKFIKTWFQNRRAWFKRTCKRYFSNKRPWKSFKSKHELCKIYRAQNSSCSGTDEAHENTVCQIIDCTEDVISMYEN